MNFVSPSFVCKTLSMCFQKLLYDVATVQPRFDIIVLKTNGDYQINWNGFKYRGPVFLQNRKYNLRHRILAVPRLAV